MTSLNDLPSLGGLGGKLRPGNRFGGGFGDKEEEDDNGFDDFDFNEDHFGDSSNKFDDAERLVQDQLKEENEGFKI